MVVVVISFLCGLALGMSAQATRISIRQEMTMNEMHACGISKLTEGEIASLEEWFFHRYAATARPAESRPLASPQAPRLPPSQEKMERSRLEAGKSETVVFNVRSKIIHRATCGHARRCTSSCVEISLAEALGRGGRWCTYCG